MSFLLLLSLLYSSIALYLKQLIVRSTRLQSRRELLVHFPFRFLSRSAHRASWKLMHLVLFLQRCRMRLNVAANGIKLPQDQSDNYDSLFEVERQPKLKRV